MAEPDLAVTPDVGTSGMFDVPTEPLYTLDQAAQIIVDMACAKNGHDFNVVTNEANRPLALTCNRCHKTGAIPNWKGPDQ